MAQKRKLPKKPKTSASLEVWKNYEKKVKEVQKHNSQIDREKEQKKKLIQKLR